MQLNVLKNDSLIESYDLSKPLSESKVSTMSFTIGRDKDCYVQIDDQQISRKHLLIEFDNDQWRLEKKSTFAVVMINGLPVQDKVLQQGDLIQVGSYVISVNMPNTSIVDNDISEKEEDDSKTETVFDASGSQDVAEIESDENEKDIGSNEEVNEMASSEDQQPRENVYGESTGEFDIDGEQLISTSDADEVSPDISEGEEEFSVDSAEEDSPEQVDDDFNSFGDDDAFADDEFAVDDADPGMDLAVSDDSKTEMIQSFANVKLEIFGEHAPYDHFNLTGNEVVIGRDPEKCQIVLNDPEVSSVHAKVKRTTILCSLEDMGSGNGTLLNGQRINNATLSNDDEFIIGSTTFTVVIKSDFLETEQERLMPVADNQEITIEEVIEVDEDGFSDEEVGDSEDGSSIGSGSVEKTGLKKYLSKEFLTAKENRLKVIGFIGVLIMGAIELLPESKPKPTPAQIAKHKAKKAKQEQKKKLDENDPFNNLAKKDQAFIDQQYQLAREFFAQKKFQETISALEQIFAFVPDYKTSKTLMNLSKEALAAIAEKEKAEFLELQRLERVKQVKVLLEKAKVAVEKRQVEVSKVLFAQILEKDPENYDVQQLKFELEAWEKEKEKKALEEAQRKAERKRIEDALKPSEIAYRQKSWFKAIKELEKYLKLDKLDKDLMEKATEMLQESRSQLSNIVEPLVGKASSLKEGGELKEAYEVYKEIITYDPSRGEVLNSMVEIQNSLKIKSRNVYRQAIISESLSLFKDAKEKFEEVLIISPSDSEYYRKAKAKLDDYAVKEDR